MSWYYYTGKMVRPIMVSKHRSKAVRPNTKIEILEIIGDTQSLIDNGILRATGNPNINIKKVKKKIEKAEKSLKEVLKASKFAASFAEKGKTSSAKIAPSSKNPEFTAGEVVVLQNDDEKNENNEQNNEDNVDLEIKDESSKRKRNKKGRK